MHLITSTEPDRENVNTVNMEDGELVDGIIAGTGLACCMPQLHDKAGIVQGRAFEALPVPFLWSEYPGLNQQSVD